jgi:hypothetical protein
MLSESELVTASMPSRMIRLLEDCELIGRLDRDDEDTEGSMAGCFLGMVGGGEGGLGLDPGDVRGLSSRGMREAGAWYTGGLEDIGVGMGSSILDSLDGKTWMLGTLERAGLLGGMDKQECAFRCWSCSCCTLVVAAGAFWGSGALLPSPAVIRLTFGWANGLKKSVMLRFGLGAID